MNAYLAPRKFRIFLVRQLIKILWWLAKEDIIFDQSTRLRFIRYYLYLLAMKAIQILRPTTGIGGDLATDLAGIYNIKDYPITLGFGAVYYPYYSQSSPHHGIDYGCPTGTQLNIGGTLVATTNNTGQSTGSHIHIDKRKGAGAYVNPSDFDTIEGVVTQVGNAGTAGIMVTINATNGFNYRFLHLKETFVSVGDELIMSRGVNATELNQLVLRYYGREPNSAERENWTGKTFEWVYDRCNGNETWNNTTHKIRNYDDVLEERNTCRSDLADCKEDCEDNGDDDNYLVPKDNVLADFEERYL